MRLGFCFLHRLLMAACGLCLLLGSAFAAERTLDISPEGSATESVALSPYIDTLEDPSGAWSLADVQRGFAETPFRAGSPSGASVGLGYSQSAFWLRLKLANSGDQDLSRLIEIANPSISVVEFYHPEASGQYLVQRTGSSLPFETRPYSHRNFLFTVAMPAHSEQVVYLRVQSTGPMSIVGKLWAPAAFHRAERRDYFGQAWYFGIASAMIVFNFLLYMALRDLIYLRYVAFVSSMTLTLASQNGLIKEFVFQDAPWWSATGVMIGFSLTLASALAFMRHMLDTPRVLPRFDLVPGALMWLMLLAPIALTWNLRAWMEPLTGVFGLVALLVLGIGVVCAFKRERNAYFFVAAFALLCMAGVLTTLRTLGVLLPNFWTENALRIGSALEMLLLAFALADRFNVMRQEKVNAQRASIEAQQRLVETLQTSERVLEQRVAERTIELDQRNQELNRAIASREDVERIARHDIKTPLASLAAAPTLLRAGRTMPAQEEVVLRMMEKAANRALDMVNLSLDLYQMEVGGYVFQPRTVHLTELLQSVVQDLGVHAHSKSVKLQLTGHEPAVGVLGSESLCYSIIANLTKNAIEAAPEHSVVALTLRDGPWVQLRIHNLGEVPPAVQETFFAKYNTHGKMGGTGLGTYSAHLLARVQGGSLTMETGATIGTTLTLTLPCAPLPPVIVGAPVERTTELPRENAPLKLPALQVLVVDDDEFNLMVMDSYLPQPPLQVATAVNGRLAVKSVMERRPDVIILDVEMPIMGGLEALERIREHQTQTAQKASYVVAYSGSDDAQSIQKYLAAGFDTCLKKPSTRQAVLALLQQGPQATP